MTAEHHRPLGQILPTPCTTLLHVFYCESGLLPDQSAMWINFQIQVSGTKYLGPWHYEALDRISLGENPQSQPSTLLFNLQRAHHEIFLVSGSLSEASALAGFPQSLTPSAEACASWRDPEKGKREDNGSWKEARWKVVGPELGVPEVPLHPCNEGTQQKAVATSAAVTSAGSPLRLSTLQSPSPRPGSHICSA